LRASVKGRLMPEEDDLRQQICDAGKRLYDRFFIAANDGNISCRLNEGEILITPTGTNKADIQPDQILKVDFKGNVLTGYMKPTSEMKMHLMVYDKRQDIQAIVHAHPPTATGFAASGVRLDQDVLLPEVIFGLGRIGFAGYATPTTQEVPEAVAREIGDCDAMLLSNHGALTVGDTVLQAYYRMETLQDPAGLQYPGEPADLEPGADPGSLPCTGTEGLGERSPRRRRNISGPKDHRSHRPGGVGGPQRERFGSLGSAAPETRLSLIDRPCDKPLAIDLPNRYSSGRSVSLGQRRVFVPVDDVFIGGTHDFPSRNPLFDQMRTPAGNAGYGEDRCEEGCGDVEHIVNES
jgi:L-fuculose-phosphate aldolase